MVHQCHPPPRLPLDQVTLRFKSSQYEEHYNIYYAHTICRFDMLCDAMLILFASVMLLKDITRTNNEGPPPTLLWGTSPRHANIQLYTGLMVLRVVVQLVAGKHLIPHRNTIMLAMRLLQPQTAMSVSVSLDKYTCSYGMRCTCVCYPCVTTNISHISVQFLVLHVLGSPMLVPLTAMIPYKNHLITVLCGSWAAVRMLSGGRRNNGLCTALQQLPQPPCVFLWHTLQTMWVPLSSALQTVRNVLGIWTPENVSNTQFCIMGVYALHLMFSVVMSSLLYYMELRSRLLWLLRNGDGHSQSAAVALLRSGGLLLAWTVNNFLFLSLLGLVSLLVVSLWLQGA